ncbi:MAG: sugar isomerase [Planctomycetia bacterium]|nr:sugar isomerase [Planctomycetia bacterium]
MSRRDHDFDPFQPHCCPACTPKPKTGITRRLFLGGTALGGAALTGLSWSMLAAAETDADAAPPRRPLRVKPIFTYGTYERRPQTSWRSWGGIEKQEQADAEVVRIQGELEKLKASADFPMTILPIAAVRSARDVEALKDTADADVLLIYAAGADMDCFAAAAKTGKDIIFFVRHLSGPVYLWYEIISPRYLRQHGDALAVKGVDFDDVVVDSQDEIMWRLRSLCGLRNTLGSKILAVGGASAWAQPGTVVPDLVKKLWKLDIQTITYDELGKLIAAARGDSAAVAKAKRRAADYLKLPGTTLETETKFVENAFLLDQVFRGLMKQAGCKAMTINSCMGTIMPIAETSACLPLSMLNDDGYLAFCESDFVVIPSGMLLGEISGKPTFLNDPTYPHDGLITLAHCTAPRKMNGKTIEPARIMTHFESDYGAAPKVEMGIGQKVTNIAPDFAAKRWLGFSGEIAAHPFLPICRSQIDVKFSADTDTIAKRMPGFHWMMVYGNYLRETGYALKRIPIEWECLG